MIEADPTTSANLLSQVGSKRIYKISLKGECGHSAPAQQHALRTLLPGANMLATTPNLQQFMSGGMTVWNAGYQRVTWCMTVQSVVGKQHSSGRSLF